MKKIFIILLSIGILLLIVEFTKKDSTPKLNEVDYYPAHLDCGY